MNLKIKDIIKCTRGVLINGNEELECENFSKDTRNIRKGDTYIGLKGDTFDGSTFWKQALDNGADTVIISTEPTDNEIKQYTNKNIIKVEDTKKALLQIATAKRELYNDLIVVGVTGSVGKTSTKDIIASILSQKYNTLKTQGNFNNDIGVPLTILNLREHDAAVIEMGMNHLGEISTLTKIAKPTLSVITNVGTSHIGNLGSRENILKAKLEILEGMKEQKVIINNDNDMLHKWAKNEKNTKIYTFGIENTSDCMASNIQKYENFTKCIANINNEEIHLEIPVGGDVFILNALCATILGKLLNLSNEQISKGIKTFELTKKRMEILQKDGIMIINDSYNASLDSMKASIEYLANTKSKRKIAVLGDMFELGSYSEELHKKVGTEVAKNKIDKLYVLGNDAKYIVEEAIKNGITKDNTYYAKDSHDLLNKIKENMREGDAILFKASNGMRLFEVVEALK